MQSSHDPARTMNGSQDNERVDAVSEFQSIAFRHPFRRYQAQALVEFDRILESDGRRCYVVMPPGSGKTVLGLEMIRRRSARALVLSPNTAVQSQWLTQWSAFQPSYIDATANPSLPTPLTVLTYQALCNLNTDDTDLDAMARDLWAHQLVHSQGLVEDAAYAQVDELQRRNPSHFRRDLAQYRRRVRRMVARGDDADQLLDLLHPNGQKIIETMQQTPRWTIVLDECHHLLEMWGYLIQALVETLGGDVFVIGLTATPPREMDQREARLYQALFGHADFEVPTPAVVKEGELSAYQELGYLTTPLPHETAYIAEQHLRFEEMITRLFDPDFGTRPFLDWIDVRVRDRLSKQGAQLSWVRFERDEPELAQAALRLFYRHGQSPPDGVRYAERHRRELTADDWVALISDYCVGHLRMSDAEADQHAWEEIRQALPSLGYVLTRNGIRSHVSPVDRVLSLSASKGLAAATILGQEWSELGSELRALVLCDYERTGSDVVAQLRGVLDPQAGSAALLLETLCQDSDVRQLSPVLMTGQTVACQRQTAEALVAHLSHRLDAAELSITSLWSSDECASDLDDTDLVRITGPGSLWAPRRYVPEITRFFEEGGCRCLVGTRGLLGEGWSSNPVNVLIDLTTATTATAVHQMRGRSLRLDTAWPEKVANNWDVVCIDPDHPKGTADYERFVRKHQNYFAPTVEGEIESGVSHVHHELSPYGPPRRAEFDSINAELLGRARARGSAYDLWEIGEPYENEEIHTVRIRFERELGLPNRRASFGAAAHANDRSVQNRLLVTGVGIAALFGVLAVGGFEVAAIGSGLGIGAAGTLWSAQAFVQRLQSLQPSDTLNDIAVAVAAGLYQAGELTNQTDPTNVQVTIQQDGYYRCFLPGVPQEANRVFSDALEEVLSPLTSPRYLIARYVADRPKTLFEGMRIAAQLWTRGRVGSSVVYHAVPSVLANNRERADLFAAAWSRYVSTGELVYAYSPEGQAIIGSMRGADPFGVTSQLRVLWR